MSITIILQAGSHPAQLLFYVAHEKIAAQNPLATGLSKVHICWINQYCNNNSSTTRLYSPAVPIRQPNLDLVLKNHST